MRLIVLVTISFSTFSWSVLLSQNLNTNALPENPLALGLLGQTSVIPQSCAAPADSEGTTWTTQIEVCQSQAF